MKRTIICSVAVFVGFLALYPFETRVVPEWRVKFVDDRDMPIANLSVEQVCYDYDLSESNVCASYPDSSQQTSPNGELFFAEKSIRLGVLSRLVRFVAFRIATLAHGSAGVKASLMVAVPPEYESAGVFPFDSGRLPPAQIVLSRK